LEARHRLEPGQYEIRADMLAEGSGEVVRRAAVHLVHEPDGEAQEEPEREVASAAPTEEPPVRNEEASEAETSTQPDEQDGQIASTELAEQQPAAQEGAPVGEAQIAETMEPVERQPVEGKDLAE